MSKTPISTKDLNEQLLDFLTEITSTGASSKSDVFDETVRETLIKHLPSATFVSSDRWSGIRGSRIFSDFALRSAKKNFDFSDLEDIVDNGDTLDLLVVDKPNGSQQWPDLLVIHNKIGFPIEVKSCKEDKVVWNGGFPRTSSLYIFNCYGKRKTTIFLGEHAITDAEIEFLQEQAFLASQFNKSNGRWSFYARNMFNSNQEFIENDDLNKRIQKYESQLKDIEFDLAEARILANVSKIGSFEERAVNLKSKIETLEQRYKEQSHRRKKTEQFTRNFIYKLPWNSKQKTYFGLPAKEKEIPEEIDNNEEAKQHKSQRSSGLGSP